MGVLVVGKTTNYNLIALAGLDKLKKHTLYIVLYLKPLD
jgi:hypothetical protein